MAQVRKFQSGGKTFKINGKTYNTSNSEDMKRLEEMASNSEYGGIAQQILANVNDAAYDNTLNVYRTSDGRVMMEGGLQNVADQYMSQGTQKATQRKDNAWNNTFKRRSGKDWINNLDSFLNAFDSKSTTSSSSTDGKIKISGVSGLGGKWKYNDQGWDEADINNAAMLKELQLLEDYYNASEEDRKNKYDVSGLDKRSLEAYINMRQNNPYLYSNYLKSFTADAPVMDNDDFYSTYGWFGFTQNPDAKKASDNKALKEYLATQGLDFDGAENVFYRDKDGNLMVTDAFLTNVLGGDRNGHYWLNDNWANLKTDNGNSNPYSQMRNHIIWNGRIYKQDDAAVLAELQKSGYVDANKAYDAAKAEQIMRTQWSDNPTFAHEAYDPETRYSEWAHDYKDRGLRYRTLESNLGEGRNLVEYYTDDDPTDVYGFRSTRYAIIGDDGKLIQDNVDPSTIAKKENGVYIPTTTYFMQKRLGQDAGALAGTYIDGTSIDGKPSNTFFYKNPTTGEFFLQDPNLKGKQKGKAVRIPKEIATMIPKEAWEYFRTNKDAKDRLFRKMKDWTNTGFGKRALHGLKNSVTFGIDDLIQNTLLKQDFQKAGLSKEQAEQVVKLLIEWGTNKKYKEATGNYDASATARQQAFLADPQTEEVVRPVFKEGGKIEKHQYGNVLGKQGKTELKTINLKESDRKDANLNQSIELGSKDSKQWSSLDSWELAGTMADLAALGVTIADPTNVGGAVAGAMGSFTNFGADIKRDGFQGKDLGRLGLNLLLDVGTLLPVAGDAISGAKAIRAMKKAAPILSKAIKAGAIVGIGDAAINTIDKIAKGESFTLSDVRRIINGISGGVTLSRTGLLNQTKHRVDVDPRLTIKGKPNSGISDIKLSKEQIKEITDVPKAEQMKKLTEVLKKAGHDVDKLDLDSVAKIMKRPQWKFWKGWDKTAVPDVSKGGSKRVNLTPENLAKLQRERNGFQNWFFGTGKTQRAYNAFLRGEQPTFSHKINIKGTPYWETGYKPTIDIPEGSAPGLVPMEYFAKQITPKTQIVSSHASPFGKRFFLRPILPNIVSTQQFPQEMEFTENVSTIPMKRLVFKKGGILKGQKGLWDLSKELVSGMDLSKLGQSQYEIGDNGVINNNLNIAEMSQRASTPKVELPETKSPIATDYAKDHAYGSGNETAATKLNGEYWENKRTVGKWGGKPTNNKSSNFDRNSLLQDVLGTSNLIRAINSSYKQKDLSDKYANAMKLGTYSAPVERGFRYNLPVWDKYNSEIAKMNSAMNLFNTNADAKVNMAGKLSVIDNISRMRENQARETSLAVSEQNQLYNAMQREDDRIRNEIANKNRQLMMSSELAKVSGEQALQTNLDNILDKAIYAGQANINKRGAVDSQISNKIYQIELAMAEAKAKNLDTSGYEQMLKTLRSQEYRDNAMRTARYAKKGGTLRSTTEQMLLDNNKNVAKAISKLSDNTMKLILKAMS